MNRILEFLSSVIAGVIANLISKWLDRREKKRQPAQGLSHLAITA